MADGMEFARPGLSFKAIEGCGYKYDYVRIFQSIITGAIEEKAAYRTLILDDLWFIIYFVMKVESANHPFVVKMCRMVEAGVSSRTLDLWAREHYKTTIITIAETVQKVLKDSEERVGIFSHTRPIAKGFLRSIKMLFEGSEILKACFPDILYNNPEQEARKWSEDDGLILRRKGFAKESTIEAWGLIEGMPTSKHFSHRVYDDIETADVVDNPDVVRKVINRFDLSKNLGTLDGTERVVGTTYSHSGVLEDIRKRKDIHGREMYLTRIIPATEDGTPNGMPVLLSQGRLDELKGNEYIFNCQQLLNPTPVGIRKLDSSLLREIESIFVPSSVFKFMVIDPAGDNKTGKGDAWAIEIWGVEPKADDLGASNIYLIDAVISPFRETEAIEEIVRMYLRNGMIMQVGVEKVALSTAEVHVANALAAKGRHISVDNNTLVILRPSGRDKAHRIEAALAWPLFNSKIFISSAVPHAYKERLRMEMDKFPYWHDDGLDAAAYLYDMIKSYHFVFWGDQSVPQYEPVNTLIGY
ncbi:MAG: hypothetical protein NUW09_02525 [Deltaproteobacteria bacterium]|nr:hypothetical protein [Deltaproteobacteria bacterium]